MKNENPIISDEFVKDTKMHDKIPEAVGKEISNVDSKVDTMSLKEVISKLKCFRLSATGNEDVLRDRLKDSYKKILIAGRDLSLSNELLPFYVIIDFEATCEEVIPPTYRYEIIEFPAVLVDSRKQEVVDCFQMYCKPQINPEISKFCTDLTGITQEQVDSAETFDKVLMHYHKWLAKHQLGAKHNYAIVTDGPWDMSRFLYSQCYYSNIKFPKWGTKWFNLRKAFNKFYKCERVCLKNMLQYLNMEFIGRPHCGLHDAKNIARILLRMIYDGANIQVNEIMTGTKEKNKNRHKHVDPLNNSVKQEGDNPIQKIRIEAHYKPIYYAEPLPIYKRTKRERLIAEIQLARKILKSPNDDEKNSATTEKIKIAVKKPLKCQ